MRLPTHRAPALRALLAALLAAAPCVARSQSPPPVAPHHSAAAAQAARGEAPRPRVIDVELQPQDLLVGQLVDASGRPLPGERVTVTLADGRQAEATTNADGGFAFRDVQGLATVWTNDSLAVTRAWKPGAAPPSATPALLLVEDQQVARGQHYAHPRTQQVFDRGKRLMANPLFVAGVVATAVAIPVALANDDDDQPASP
ncbi:carboxypeptidase-like regulatory domain-containing protein [Botrimarina sp.]|uniref:carboxypeptidase-like regulatory domain-containing protein n=1 Tax=Botrimarina sp. TaxID=2795802 RepID=UPI0032F03537